MDIQNTLQKIEQYWQIIRNLHYHIQEEGSISEEEYALIKKYLSVIGDKYATLIQQQSITVAPISPIEKIQQAAPQPEVVSKPTIEEPVFTAPQITPTVVEEVIPEEIPVVIPEKVMVAPQHDPLKDLRSAPAPDQAVSSILEKMLEGKITETVKIKSEPSPSTGNASVATSLSQNAQTPSLNDRLKANTSAREEINSRMRKTISESISLNDKFEFIRELFSNNTVEYAIALQRLESFSSLNEAMAFVEVNYSVKYQWEKKETTAEKFRAVVRQRFS